MEAMILFPDIQKKGQESVDRVTGGKRLPEYGDQESLPYIQALIREVVRWRPLLPLGLAHSNNEGDMYKGYYIPKGALLFSSCAGADGGRKTVNRQHHPPQRLASGYAAGFELLNFIALGDQGHDARSRQVQGPGNFQS